MLHKTDPQTQIHSVSLSYSLTLGGHLITHNRIQT